MPPKRHHPKVRALDLELEIIHATHPASRVPPWAFRRGAEPVSMLTG
jgi:hypothetical protein